MTAADLAALTLTPGIHNGIQAERYHNDPTERPSLSSSIAHLLVTRSPAHAFTAHPRLNPNFERETEPKFDVGTAVHSLLLEGKQAVCVCDYADWRTKAAQEERDTARALGMIPMLAHQWEAVQAMSHAVAAQLADRGVEFNGGRAEQTMVWEEQGVLCRARVDWIYDTRTDVLDVKTTARLAEPEKWSRGPLYDHGADIQAAFYLRGLEKIIGHRPTWRWIVMETAPPYAVSVIEPSAAVLAIGDAKVDMALDIWRSCLASGEWPAYPPVVHRAELPHWIETQWIERENREAA